MNDPVFEGLEKVKDRESFLEFVEALAAERENAETIEAADPSRFELGGARGWQNGSISSFLYAAASGMRAAMAKSDLEKASWKGLAEFLWLGKIYE